MRRSWFVDVGRWTFGVWPAQERALLTAGFMRFRPEAWPCGMSVTCGRATVAFFALMPRGEWTDFKARTARRGER
ncbi:hypothetical protein [Streptomyces sp. NPDC046685]|uniref:hypothetical protein n=1 Tax=Streptomyces sp. NPDC046685 TaxID=3157202 RepID=UPI00340A0468